MQKRVFKITFISCTALLLTHCGKSSSSNKETFKINLPKLGDIVQTTLPVALGTLPAPTGLNLAGSQCTPADSTDCAKTPGFLNYIKSYIFNKSTDPTVALPTYYRYWVDTVDTALAQMVARTSSFSVDDQKARCFKNVAKEVTFTFPVQGQPISVKPKLYCWESQTTPQGSGATQNFAFGKDGNDYWLVFRTKDAGQTSGRGSRIVIAKATADGDSAEIWFVGGSWQSANGTLAYRVNAQRIVANKSTKQFTFNAVEDAAMKSNFVSFFGNTDGNNLYLEARSTDPAQNGNVVDVQGMIPGAGYCSKANVITEVSTECGTLKSPPANFGLSKSMHNADYTKDGVTIPVALNAESFAAAIQSIEAINYSAQGIEEFKGDTPTP